MTGFAIVHTTVADAGTARDLARFLVAERHAACVQITPVASIYRWNGAVEESGEHLLAAKIAAADFAAVAAAIRARHGYEVPEIVMVPIVAGDAPYLDWLDTALRAPDGSAK